MCWAPEAPKWIDYWLIWAIFFCTTACQPIPSGLVEGFRKSSVCFQFDSVSGEEKMICCLHIPLTLLLWEHPNYLALSHRQMHVRQRQNWFLPGTFLVRVRNALLPVTSSDVTPEFRKLFAAVPPSQLWQQLWMAGCPALSSPERPCQRPGSLATGRIQSAT